MQVIDDPADGFPKLDAFMHALQDPGKPSKQTTKKRSNGASSTTDMMIVYPKLKNVLAGVQGTLQAKYAHIGIVPKYVTDCKKQLVALACVRIQKSWHKAVVPEELQK